MGVPMSPRPTAPRATTAFGSSGPPHNSAAAPGSDRCIAGSQVRYHFASRSEPVSGRPLDGESDTTDVPGPSRSSRVSCDSTRHRPTRRDR
jgi:hypothetical protein